MYTGHRCFGRFPHDVQMERDRCCKQDDRGRRSRTTGSGYVVCSRRQRVIGRQHGDRLLQDHYDYLISILRPGRRSEGDTEEPGRERGDDTMTQHESTRIETTEAAGRDRGAAGPGMLSVERCWRCSFSISSGFDPPDSRCFDISLVGSRRSPPGGSTAADGRS